MKNSTWTIIRSALVSGILMGFLGIAGYVIAVADIFQLDWKVMANVGVMSFLTSVVSLIKSGLTTSTGEVAGIKVR